MNFGGSIEGFRIQGRFRADRYENHLAVSVKFGVLFWGPGMREAQEWSRFCYSRLQKVGGRFAVVSLLLKALGLGDSHIEIFWLLL